MANKRLRNIPGKRKVVRRRTRQPLRPNRELAFPSQGGLTFTCPVVVERYCPPTSRYEHEACFTAIPLNCTGINAIKEQAGQSTHYRISNVRIFGETATRSSTQVVGIGNAYKNTVETLSGFGNLARAVRRCYFTKRSSVGGYIDVRWSIPSMAYKEVTSDSLEFLPMVILGLSDAAYLQDDKAWFEIYLTVHFLGPRSA